MRAEFQRETVVRVRIESEDGTLISADSTPTIVVKDGTGAIVAGVSAVSTDGTGVYKATIPAQSTLDRLSLTWTATVGGFVRTYSDRVSLVSERLVPFWRLREDSELTSASVKTLQRLADGVEEWFKDALHFPPVVESYRRTWSEKYETTRLHVPGALFPVSLIALSRGRGPSVYVYTSTDLADITVIEDGFEKTSGTSLSFIQSAYASMFPAGPWTAWITHGLQDPPEDLRRAAATFARYIARTSNYPERASRVVTQETEITFSFPSPDKPTGLPEVDAVLNRLRIPALG